MSAPVDATAVRRWVVELALSSNGLHEIREGAVNERNRPLIGYAATYEIGKAIVKAHNDSAATDELIAMVEDVCRRAGPDREPNLRAALARVRVEGEA